MLKMMDFPLKLLMNSAKQAATKPKKKGKGDEICIKMMNFVFKTMKFALKMMNLQVRARERRRRRRSSRLEFCPIQTLCNSKRNPAAGLFTLQVRKRLH